MPEGVPVPLMAILGLATSRILRVAAGSDATARFIPLLGAFALSMSVAGDVVGYLAYQRGKGRGVLLSPFLSPSVIPWWFTRQFRPRLVPLRKRR